MRLRCSVLWMCFLALVALAGCKTEAGKGRCVRKEIKQVKDAKGKLVWHGERWLCSNRRWDAIEQWQMGKRHGLQRKWHTYTHKIDKGNGNIFYARKRDIVKEEENYIHGTRHGTFSRWYRDGALQAESFYVKGKQHGWEKKWFKDGKLQYMCQWQMGKRIGPETEWYPNGQRKHLRTWKLGKQVGEEQRWSATGKKTYSKHFVDGYAHGTYQWWLSNGETITGSYDRDRINGTEIIRFANGKTKATTAHRTGFKEGPAKEWHPNGQLKLQTHYSWGVKTGLYQTWYPNGKPKSKGQYLLYKVPGVGKSFSMHSGKHGLWHTWGKDGNLHLIFYNKGKHCLPPNQPANPNAKNTQNPQGKAAPACPLEVLRYEGKSQ